MTLLEEENIRLSAGNESLSYVVSSLTNYNNKLREKVDNYSWTIDRQVNEIIEKDKLIGSLEADVKKFTFCQHQLDKRDISRWISESVILIFLTYIVLKIS